MNHATYHLKHTTEARAIGQAIYFIEADLAMGFLPTRENEDLQILGKFLSDTQTGTARTTLDEAFAATTDCAQLEFDDEGEPV